MTETSRSITKIHNAIGIDSFIFFKAVYHNKMKHIYLMCLNVIGGNAYIGLLQKQKRIIYFYAAWPCMVQLTLGVTVMQYGKGTV